jgi:hypothetical protein
VNVTVDQPRDQAAPLGIDDPGLLANPSFQGMVAAYGHDAIPRHRQGLMVQLGGAHELSVEKHPIG